MTVLSLMSLAACRQSSSNSSSGGGRPLKEVAEELVKVEASGQGSSKQGAKRAAAAELILHLRRDLDVLPCWPGDGCVGREGQCATVHVLARGWVCWQGGSVCNCACAGQGMGVLAGRVSVQLGICWPGDGCVGREGQCATVHVKVLGAMLWCGGFLVCCTSCCHTASHIGWCRVGRHEARV